MMYMKMITVKLYKPKPEAIPKKLDAQRPADVVSPLI